MTESRSLREDLRLHWVDAQEALLLDRATGRIIRASGRAAESLRDGVGHAIADPEVAAALADLGLTAGDGYDRRSVLRTVPAAALGLAVLTLPGASASASTGVESIPPAALTTETATTVSISKPALSVASVGEHAYIGAGGINTGTFPFLVKVHVPTMTVAGEVQLGATTATPFAITTDGTDVFVALTNGWDIYRVALTGGGEGTGGLQVLGSISLQAENARPVALARSGSYLYAAGSSVPSRIVKIALVGGAEGTGGMLRVGALILASGEVSPSSFGMTVIGDVAYLGHFTTPARVSVVDLKSATSDLPERLGGVTLATGEDSVAALTSVGTDVLLTTNTSPSTLVRFATSGGAAGSGGLLRLGSLPLTATNQVRALAPAPGYVFAVASSGTRTLNRVALTGGTSEAGGMRIDDDVVLPSGFSYDGPSDAVIIGGRLVIAARGGNSAVSVATGI